MDTGKSSNIGPPGSPLACDFVIVLRGDAFQQPVAVFAPQVPGNICEAWCSEQPVAKHEGLCDACMGVELCGTS